MGHIGVFEPQCQLCGTARCTTYTPSRLDRLRAQPIARKRARSTAKTVHTHPALFNPDRVVRIGAPNSRNQMDHWFECTGHACGFFPLGDPMTEALRSAAPTILTYARVRVAAHSLGSTKFCFVIVSHLFARRPSIRTCIEPSST